MVLGPSERDSRGVCGRERLEADLKFRLEYCVRVATNDGGAGAEGQELPVSVDIRDHVEEGLGWRRGRYG